MDNIGRLPYLTFACAHPSPQDRRELNLELATKLAMLLDQLETRPGFAEGALHVPGHSANWCGTHPDCLAPCLRFRFLGIGTEPSPSRDSGQLSDIAGTFDWLIRRGQARLAIGFHHLYLGAMLRWLADPRVKFRKEFAAAVEWFLYGAAVPAKASPRTLPKFRKRDS